MCPWTEFYKGRLTSEDYREYVSARYWPFIKHILHVAKDGDRLIEVGCGLATITSILSRNALLYSKFLGFRCYDISPDMVQYAKQNLSEGYPVEVGDCCLPTGRYPDIVHSHGLLEHLTDEKIHTTIAAERKDGARYAFHYVPSYKYEVPSFGDERLLSAQDWRSICSPTEIIEFNDGYDYILVWHFH